MAHVRARRGVFAKITTTITITIRDHVRRAPLRTPISAPTRPVYDVDYPHRTLTKSRTPNAHHRGGG
jgi:hypothetical protein